MTVRDKEIADYEKERLCVLHAESLAGADLEDYLATIEEEDPKLASGVRDLLKHLPPPEAHEPKEPTILDYDLQPGDHLGRFRIIKPLGKGGMGAVYKAHDPLTGNDVALKTILPELATIPSILRRFIDEINNGMKVSDKHVCRINDIVPQDDPDSPLAFSMELLEGGETLLELIRRKGKLSAEEALPLARQMAEGLEALHERQIWHRDFKPGNVIITETEAGAPLVKITDFGLSRRQPRGLRDEDSISQPGEIPGTLPYMAPEQLRGEKDKIGAATDVYAFGLVLYEMVTGLRPFSAKSSAENLVQKTETNPRSPTELSPDLGKPWDEAVFSCLKPNPVTRPQSPAAVIRIIEGELVSPPVPAQRHADSPDKEWPYWRLWAPLALAAAVLLALLGPGSRLKKVEKQRSVAILPLQAIGGDEQLQETADVLTGAITRRLSRFETENDDLVVMAAGVVDDSGASSWREAARRLGVNYVVEGDLQATGNTLILGMTPIDVEAGHQLPTQTVRGSRDNLLAIQYGAGTKLANVLELTIQLSHTIDAVASGELEPGAAEFYAAGVGYLERSFDTGNITKAIRQFGRALEIDQNYAEAHAGLAEANWRLFVRDRGEEALRLAKEHAARSLQLNDQLAEAHIAQGHIHAGTGERKKAILDFRNALDLSPRSGDALEGLAQAYGKEGLLDEARKIYDQAVRLRSGDWKAHHQQGSFFFRNRMFAEAVEPFRNVTELTPDNVRGFTNLGSTLHSLGRIEEAKRYYQQALEIERDPVAVSNLGRVYYEDGNYQQALPLFEEAAQLRPRSYIGHQNLAAAYEIIGDSRAKDAYLHAARAAQRALATNPEHEELYSRLAFYFLRAGDRAQARTWLEKALGRKPAESMEAARNAATLVGLDRFEEACEWVRLARRMGHTQQQLEEFRGLESILAEPACGALLRAA